MHSESIGVGLGKERIGNISSKPPTSVDGGSRTMEIWFFSLASTMFNFLLQGTFQLLEGRGVVRQCSRELRACRAAKPGFFVVLQPKLVSFLLVYRHVEFGMEKSRCVCASVSVHKDSWRRWWKCVSHMWTMLTFYWAGALRGQETGAGCQQACSCESRFLPLLLQSFSLFILSSLDIVTNDF